MTDTDDIRFGVGDDFEALEKQPPQKLNIWGRKLRRLKRSNWKGIRDQLAARRRELAEWEAGQDED
jgi:hypothetical protein